MQGVQNESGDFEEDQQISQEELKKKQEEMELERERLRIE